MNTYQQPFRAGELPAAFILLQSPRHKINKVKLYTEKLLNFTFIEYEYIQV